MPRKIRNSEWEAIAHGYSNSADTEWRIMSDRDTIAVVVADRADNEATALLLAAGPEMLAALRRFVTSETEQSDAIRSQALAMAKVAIAKAKGK